MQVSYTSSLYVHTCCGVSALEHSKRHLMSYMVSMKVTSRLASFLCDHSNTGMSCCTENNWFLAQYRKLGAACFVCSPEQSIHCYC